MEKKKSEALKDIFLIWLYLDDKILKSSRNKLYFGT